MSSTKLDLIHKREINTGETLGLIFKYGHALRDFLVIL